MRIRASLFAAAGAVALLSPTARADLPALTDESFSQLVATVMIVDWLKPMCANVRVQKAVSMWERANGADVIRAATRRLKADAPSAARLGDARAAIHAQLADRKKACGNLATTVLLEESQFAEVQPDLLARLAGVTGPAGPST